MLVFLFCLIIVSVQEDAMPYAFAAVSLAFCLSNISPFLACFSPLCFEFSALPLFPLSYDTLCLVHLNVGKAHPSTQHGAQ